ncbi:MAG: FtsX-like permease family protein [Ignavibacteria bacterium]|nr:FtsX-like permease family protein [Ignavibacteria bacterium]
MKFPLKIAIRYIFTIRSFHFITVISVLSAIGILLGVAALIIITSLFSGFRDFAQREIISLDPHIRIILDENSAHFDRNIMYRKILSTDPKALIIPYKTSKILIAHNQGYRVAQLYLVDDSLFPMHPISEKIFVGLRQSNGFGIVAPPSLVLGINLADGIRILPGDTITISTVESFEKSAATLTFPSYFKVRVDALFRTNNTEYDNNFIFAAESQANYITKSKVFFAGFDIRCSDLDLINRIKEDLQRTFPNLTIHTWFDLNKEIMNAMQFERYAVFIVLTLIVSIAVFNILASLFMTVLEKRPDIAIFYSLGATKKQVQQIFILQGTIIGTISTILGLFAGLGFTIGQIKYEWIKLNTQKYVISALPMKIEPLSVIAIVCVSIFLAYIATIYPSSKASIINVSEAIYKE